MAAGSEARTLDSPTVAVSAAAVGSASGGWLSAGRDLVKFRYHITYLNVVFGALIFAAEPNRSLAWHLAALYVSFNVLLYSGLYAINDLADRTSDAEHPLKRHRPIAAGRVTARQAGVWIVFFLSAGFATGAFIGTDIVSCYGVIVGINLAYSLGGRNVIYLDVLLNGLPHVVRFLMGVLLVGRRPPLTHLVTFLLVAIAISCLRRRVEMDVRGYQARQSLRRWSIATLNRAMAVALTGMLCLTVWKAPTAPGFYATIAGSAVVLIGGAYTSRHIRQCLRWVWTH
jgi:4-hydroxybenzoate polyprenyltransferase